MARNYYVENLEMELRRLEKLLQHTRARMHGVHREIRERDKPAIDAYVESTRHLSNLHTRSWQELSEESRNEWRKNCGIRPVYVFDHNGSITNIDEINAWDNQS